MNPINEAAVALMISLMTQFGADNQPPLVQQNDGARHDEPLERQGSNPEVKAKSVDKKLRLRALDSRVNCLQLQIGNW